MSEPTYHYVLVNAVPALRAAAIVVSLSLALSSASAQRTVADTATDYLVRVTQRWGASSPIGALATRSMDADDVELRVWGGYGHGGTSGVILRRTGGRWQAWRARVVQCFIDVSTVAGDGASPPTDSTLAAEARRRCQLPAATGGAFYRADTLALEPADQRRAGVIWDHVVRAGVLELPPKDPHGRIMIDGFTIVIEVRRGGVYRTSKFHAVRPPEVAADSAARQIHRTVFDEFGPPRKKSR